MFSQSLRATLIALVASAAFVSAAPGLSVKVAGPETVTGADDFNVKTIITNTGDETLKLLNHPLSPLSDLPANTFQITDAKGAVPAFTGVKAKYVPSVAIANGENAVTVLAPGQSVEVEHDLSEAYDFSESGEGAYLVEANDLFYMVNSENEPIPLHAETEGHLAKLTGKLGVTRRTIKRRANFNGCSAQQQGIIYTAASDAQKYAYDASAASRNPLPRPRYVTWFGAPNGVRQSTVVDHFGRISGNRFSAYNFDCTCTRENVYAYVYPNQFGTVYLCPQFWKAPATGTDSKAGTIVHEASHFTQNGGTVDVVYGQPACQDLARRNPDRAVTNADSHEYFAENTPQLQ